MKKIGYAIGLVVLVIIGVVSGVYITQNLDEDVVMTAQEVFSSEKEEEKFLVEVGPILSNLKHTEVDKHEYIKVKFSIEVSGNKNKEHLEEQLPVVRDTINKILRKTAKEEVFDVEDGEMILKRTIINEINLALHEETKAVTNINIIDLLLQ